MMEENMVLIREPKTFYFDFDWPKNVDKNLKLEIKFIIKCNESLAENKMKNEIEQLLSKIGMEMMYMENSKTIEPHNLFLTCYNDQT